MEERLAVVQEHEDNLGTRVSEIEQDLEKEFIALQSSLKTKEENESKLKKLIAAYESKHLKLIEKNAKKESKAIKDMESDIKMFRFNFEG